MSRIAGLSGVVVLGWMLCACETAGGGAPIEVPTDPLTATGTLDPSRAGSKQFGWHAGGVLSVTNAEGVVFSLRVPDTALTEETTITMTPYATLTTPLGESSYGVQFEPEGLFPTSFLELTITPPSGQTWDLGQQVPFGLAGATNVVSLALLDASAREVVLEVGHFSSYGLALAKKGFDASLEATRHRLGGDLESQLENELGEALIKERQAVQANAESGDIATLFTSFGKRYYEQVIKPRLAAAKDSCAAARLAAQTALGFERTMQLIGLDTATTFGFTFSFPELFAGAEVCMKEEYELCRDNHIITRIIPAFLGVLRQGQLLGFDGTETVSIQKMQLEQYLNKCLKFDLEMSSALSFSEGSGVDNHTVNESMHLTHATAGYVINTDENPSGLPAIDLTGALITGTFVDFPVSGYDVYYANNCVSVTSKTPGPGQLAMTTVSFSRQDGDLATRAHVKDFSLVLALIPNTSSHEVSRRSRDSTGTCSGTAMTETMLENWSMLGFAPWFSSLGPSSADAYLTGWTIQSGDILATKDVNWSNPEGSHLTANFVLRHVPDPR